MGQVHDAVGDSKEALKSFQGALQLREELGDKAGLGDTLIDLANYYGARGENDQALGLLKRSLQIQREVGITTVFVTHDQEEALTLSDRVAIFNEGKVVQAGRPLEVYERPTTAFAPSACQAFQGQDCFFNVLALLAEFRQHFHNVHIVSISPKNT